MTKIRTKIINFLKTTDEASRTAIYNATKIPYYVLVQELEEMEKEGLITVRLNDTESFVYYKLKEKGK